MRPRGPTGQYLSWDQAIALLYDEDAVAAANRGEAWAAWIWDVLDWEETTGEDAADYESYAEFVEGAEDTFSEGWRERYDLDEFDAGAEFEVTADSDSYTRGKGGK